MTTQIEAELKRRPAGGGSLVDWELVTDAENTGTGRSDPVIDYGVRELLTSTISGIGNGAGAGGNSTITPLGAGGVFVGAWEDVSAFATISILARVDQVSATNGALVQFSNDGVTARRTIAATISTVNVGLPFEIPVEAQYFRIVYTNGATPQALFVVQTIYHRHAMPNAQFLLGQTVTDNNLAQLVRAVGTAKQPDGDYINVRADGTAFTEDDTNGLAPAGVFLSSWFDTDGWASAELFVATDQISGSLGIEIEFTDDVQGAQTVRGTRRYTFSAVEVTSGFVTFRFPTELDGLRVRYTNGGTGSSFLFIQLNLRTGIVQPQSSYETELNASNIAVMVRGILAGKNDLGVYDNITRSDLGGLRMAVTEHESLTPIGNLTHLEGSAQSIAAATKIVDQTTVPANARSIYIQAGGTNNQIVYFSTASATTTNGGALFELDAGQAVTLEIGEGLDADIWAAPASGTQRVRVMYLTGDRTAL